MSTISTEKQQPTISVVIPCHNSGAFLRQAVESALAQRGGFTLVEVLIVDDHSDDPQTLEELVQFADHALVRVIHNSGRRGASAARNFGIRVAKGDWIAFLDADDIWLDGSLDARSNVVMAHPECRWVTGDFAMWHGDRSCHHEAYIMTHESTGGIVRCPEGNDIVHLRRPVEHLVRALPTCTITTMLRRDLIVEVGCFDESLIQAEDRHLWIRLARVADLWFIHNVLALYRQHSKSLTKTPEVPGRWMLRCLTKLLTNPDFVDHREVIREQIARWHIRQGLYFRRRREFFKGVQCYARSLYYRPRSVVGWRGLVASMIRRN